MDRDVEPVVVRQDGGLGGRPTFPGTRVQAEILFENLAEGHLIDEILEDFPRLDRNDLRAAIIEAGRLIIERAPTTSTFPTTDATALRETSHARLSR
ncbi:DUF433 domain-containing protein [Aureimonas sp. Leaf454]|uniref:DUF433 domain-containing protein n=1 Tax=Aureimonas sp. Leaf454 TaxID=1736381 RepID=UPI0009EB7A82|nr:DUF433 domain-containing protein [Aureimonas sp. Leaf454]